MKKIHFSRQTRFILIAAAAAAVTALAAYNAVNLIENKLDKSYADFAQQIVKITAIEAGRLANIYPDTVNTIFKDSFDNFIRNNDDISYIEYKDTNNNIIYSFKKNNSAPENQVLLRTSSPVYSKNSLRGFIQAGMTGKSLMPVSKAVKTALYGASVLLWFFIILSLCLISNRSRKPLIKNNEENIEKLKLERSKFEAVLMSIINGVVVCGIRDNVVLANSAALKMLEIDETRFVNTNIQDFVDSHGIKCFKEKIEEFKETPINISEQKPVEFNIEAGKRTIKAAISPMFLKQREYTGYIIVLIDITREEEVNRLKNTFISNVSHELRTPVTVLRTYIDTLCNNADDFDEDTKQEFMQTIDNEAKRLHSMVNEILDFSRIESEEVKLRKEYADLTEILQQNINSIKILADEKNIKISFTQTEALPKIPINIESIDRAVRNLLSNAVKYSFENGEILVTCGLSADKQYAEFSVQDNGIGIAPEYLDKIFDRFFRVENKAHTIKGTGLGLHLVKMTVEKHHHGRITVKSRENEGSKFTVLLPLSIDEAELA